LIGVHRGPEMLHAWTMLNPGAEAVILVFGTDTREAFVVGDLAVLGFRTIMRWSDAKTDEAWDKLRISSERMRLGAQLLQDFDWALRAHGTDMNRLTLASNLFALAPKCPDVHELARELGSARSLGASRKRLWAKLTSAGMPAPSDALSICRFVWAVRFREEGLSYNEVAKHLSLASPRMLMRRLQARFGLAGGLKELDQFNYGHALDGAAKFFSVGRIDVPVAEWIRRLRDVA
jgi:hypothetical protein